MARYYFEMHGGWEYSYPYIKMGTGEDGQVTILLYKEGDEDEHVAVYGNYTVDRKTRVPVQILTLKRRFSL